MPYIAKEYRSRLDAYIELIPIEKFSTGELNYLLTRLLLKNEPKSYYDFDVLIGLLECMKLELYRRKIAPYEDEKMQKNGDVF